MGLNLYVCRHCGRRFKGKGWDKNVVKSSCRRIPCLVKARFSKEKILEIRKNYHEKYGEEKKFKELLN